MKKKTKLNDIEKKNTRKKKEEKNTTQNGKWAIRLQPILK